MHYIISGKTLKRLTALSVQCQTPPEVLAPRIFRKGLLLHKDETERLLILSPKERKIIGYYPQLTCIELAQQFKKSPRLIKNHRLALLGEYIRDHFGEEDDTTLGQKFGLEFEDVRRRRTKLGFCFKQGEHNKLKDGSLKQLGDREEVVYALTSGGKCIIDLLRVKGMTQTRERGRQLVAKLGLYNITSQRTPSWYAHRLCGPGREKLAKKLADKEWVEAKLKRVGGASTLASKLGFASQRLKSYFRDRLKVNETLVGNQTRMVKLRCARCTKVLFRPQYVIRGKQKQHPHNARRMKHFCNRSCYWEEVREHWGHWFRSRGAAPTHAALARKNGV